jgi:hypothetical protein
MMSGQDKRMRAPVVIITVVLALLASGRGGMASDTPSGSAARRDSPAVDPQTLITRSEWKQRVEEARARSRAFLAKARAGLIKPPHRTDKERASEASDAAMNDQSLRQGDIVSTTNGLLVYTGRNDTDPKPDDFMPLSSQKIITPGREAAETPR